MKTSFPYSDDYILDQYLGEVIQLYFAGCPALIAIEKVRAILIEKDLLAKVQE